MLMFFVGIDWGSKEHAVCVVREDRRVESRFKIAHDADGFYRLLDSLTALASRGTVRISIERPNGVLVDALLDAGFDVAAVRSDALRGWQARYSSNRSKSDRGDAYVLADVLRSDAHLLRSLRRQTGDITTLRELQRHRDFMVKERVRLSNQLYAYLEDSWPGATSLFSKFWSKISLAFLRAYPTPQAASGLDEKQMAAFLKKQGYSGKKAAAAALIAKLRAAPQRRLHGTSPKSAELLLVCQIEVLEKILEATATIEAELFAVYAKHPDAAIFDSVPNVGPLTGPKLLARIGDQRDRFASAEDLVAFAGASPVTIESGNSRSVNFRRACDHDLRFATAVMAQRASLKCPYSKAAYAALRARGKSHPQALRVIARFWLRVIHRLWKNRELYDPKKHRAIQAPQKAA